MHQNWHALYDDELGLDVIGFEDACDPNSTWRKTHPQYKIISSLIELTEYSDMTYLILSIFLFFVIFRMLNMLAYFSSSIAMNLILLNKILNFMTTYVLTLGFVFLAWAMC